MQNHGAVGFDDTTVRKTRLDISKIGLMQDFVKRKLAPWPEFRAALVIGSVAHGESRADSDVDCVLVFDQLHEAIVPAEFVWVPATDSYKTIFEIDASEAHGIQIDAKRLLFIELGKEEWTESFKHELSHAIVIFDRDRAVSRVLEGRLKFPDDIRLSRIRNHLGWAFYHLESWRLVGWLSRGGIESANDQLTAAFEEIMQLLHAYNGEWLPARYRWLVSTKKLLWLPNDFSQRVARITTQHSLNQRSLLKRSEEMNAMLDDIRRRLLADSLISSPEESFIAAHPGLGYAHNFDEWSEVHQRLLRLRDMA